ncbi:MAG: hypothetical protein ACO3F5_08690 [Gemmatimonadaceae bacterium]
MGPSEASRAEALDALLADKRRHEGYLQRLEERREVTPAHLFARLHEEYSARLAELRRRALDEAAALADGLAEDEAAVAEVEGRLATITEERAEGELRAAVGEYDPRSWAKKLAALNAAISAVEGERDARLAALEHRRALLAEASGAVEGAPIPELPVVPPPQIRPIIAAPIRLDAVPPLSPSAPAVSAPSPPAAAPVAPVAATAPLAPELPLATAFVLPDGPLVAPVDPAPDAPEASGAADSGKSLRCEGCGTPNFPTEWYCERCGGELAAV